MIPRRTNSTTPLLAEPESYNSSPLKESGVFPLVEEPVSMGTVENFLSGKLLARTNPNFYVKKYLGPKFRRLGYTLGHSRNKGAEVAPIQTAQELVVNHMADPTFPVEFQNAETRQVLTTLVAMAWKSDKYNLPIESLVKSSKNPCSSGFVISNMKKYLRDVEMFREAGLLKEGDASYTWGMFLDILRSPESTIETIDAWIHKLAPVERGTNSSLMKAQLLVQAAIMIAGGYLLEDSIKKERDRFGRILRITDVESLGRHKGICGADPAIDKQTFIDRYLTPMVGGRRLRKTRRRRFHK